MRVESALIRFLRCMLPIYLKTLDSTVTMAATRVAEGARDGQY